MYPVTLGRCAGLFVAFAMWAFSGTANAQTTGATFGDVIRLQGGTPSDVVLDEFHHLLYLVNNPTGVVTIYDYITTQVTGTIQVGKSPVAGALSMDGDWLYVTSGATPTQTASGSPLLNIINTNSRRLEQTVLL